LFLAYRQTQSLSSESRTVRLQHFSLNSIYYL